MTASYQPTDASMGSSSIITALVVAAVVSFIASKLFKKYTRGGTGGGEAALATPAPAARAALAIANSGDSDTLDVRLLTKNFSGWKIAVDLDVIAERSSNSTRNFKLRTDGSTDYFSTVCEKADAFVFAQISSSALKAAMAATGPSSDTVNALKSGDVSRLPEAQAVLSLLRPFGKGAKGALRREQVLFCSTSKGHESFTRQLQPSILITTREEVVSLVCKHIPFVVLVKPTGAAAGAIAAHPQFPNVVTISSLGALVS